MIRPFDLGDFFLVCRLQRLGVWLDPRHSLSGSELPAWAALSAPFRWWGGDVSTYVSRGAGEGIIQMRVRSDHAEADIVFLAPAPDCTEGSGELWGRLLFHCARQAGRDRVQRIFSTVPEDCGELVSEFRKAGFVPYTRDEVYLVGQPSVSAVHSRPEEVRPVSSADAWALTRLYSAVTPRLVQQAEAVGTSEDRRLPAEWEAGHWDRFVLLRDGHAVGLVVVLPGRSGHCLSLWGNFEDDGEVALLLERGLVSLAAYARRPVYVLIREYQPGVRAVLADRGLGLHSTWVRLVKHTVVRAREPARRSWVASQARPEPSVPGAVPSGAVGTAVGQGLSGKGPAGAC
jgi:hypothetical protein